MPFFPFPIKVQSVQQGPRMFSTSNHLVKSLDVRKKKQKVSLRGKISLSCFWNYRLRRKIKKLATPHEGPKKEKIRNGASVLQELFTAKETGPLLQKAISCYLSRLKIKLKVKFLVIIFCIIFIFDILLLLICKSKAVHKKSHTVPILEKRISVFVWLYIRFGIIREKPIKIA